LLKVTQNIQQSSHSAIDYYYYSVPEISQLVPNSGPTTGGTQVHIKGRQMYPFQTSNIDVTNTTWVRFGEKKVRAQLVNTTHTLVVSPAVLYEGPATVEVSYLRDSLSLTYYRLLSMIKNGQIMVFLFTIISLLMSLKSSQHSVQSKEIPISLLLEPTSTILKKSNVSSTRTLLKDIILMKLRFGVRLPPTRQDMFNSVFPLLKIVGQEMISNIFTSILLSSRAFFLLAVLPLVSPKLLSLDKTLFT